MSLTLEMPAPIEARLQKHFDDLPRRALEALAVCAYQEAVLSQRQVGEMLGLTFWETEHFLKENHAYLHYSEADFSGDTERLQQAHL